MATLVDFTADKATVLPGGTVVFTAIFDLSPGQADKVLSGELRDAFGALVGTVQVTLDNPDAEPDPTGLTFQVVDENDVVVGTVTGASGTRNDSDTYTATFTWVAP